MTEPTAKPTVTSNSQHTTASATSTANADKKDVKGKVRNKPHTAKNKQKTNITPALDKAALLALFTLSNTESNVELGAEQARLDFTSSSESNSSETNIAAQRLALYRRQHERTRQLYMASAATRPTYLVQTLKTQFAEYQQYLLAQQLDKRGLMDTDGLERLWQQLHVVDDIIEDIVRHMPAQ